MTTTVKAYAAPSATDPLEPTTIERRDVGAHDVLIEITYAGICHSDIHTVRGEWGDIAYPLVVGHEIVGEVTEVGAEVTKHQVGDRVGVGCMVNSCRECDNCRAGEEQYCLNGNVGTYGSKRPRRHHHPGRLLHPRRRRRGLRAAGARGDPLRDGRARCCAPASPRTRRCSTGSVGPGKKVAVVGLGGLGHMGVKIAARDGRRGHRAVADAEQAGGRPAPRGGALLRHQRRGDLRDAGEHVRPDPQHRQRQARPGAYLAMLALDGTMVNVGAPPEPLPIQVFTLFTSRRSFAGSGIGGIRETQEMLDFCAEHGIAPEVEVISRRPGQRGLRAGARLRRPLPLRDRHLDAGLRPGRQPRRADRDSRAGGLGRLVCRCGT